VLRSTSYHATSGVCLLAVALISCTDRSGHASRTQDTRATDQHATRVLVESFSARGIRGEKIVFHPADRRISFLFFFTPESDCPVCYVEFFRQVGTALERRRGEGPSLVVLGSPPTEAFLSLLPDAFRDGQLVALVEDFDSKIADRLGIQSSPYVIAADASQRVLLAAGVSAVEAQQRIWGELLDSIYAVR
jgi:hypothetical protein